MAYMSHQAIEMEQMEWMLAHQSLLRRLLSWPLLWRLAHRLIVRYIEHTSSGDCLLCAAKLRALKYAHTPALGLDRLVYCRKCGLRLIQWNAIPKCCGKRPPVKPVVSSENKIVPVGW